MHARRRVNNFGARNLEATYRFIAQLLNVASQKRCLTHTRRHIPLHIKIEIRMQRHVWVDAIIVSSRPSYICNKRIYGMH